MAAFNTSIWSCSQWMGSCIQFPDVSFCFPHEQAKRSMQLLHFFQSNFHIWCPPHFNVCSALIKWNNKKKMSNIVEHSPVGWEKASGMCNIFIRKLGRWHLDKASVTCFQNWFGNQMAHCENRSVYQMKFCQD